MKRTFSSACLGEVKKVEDSSERSASSACLGDAKKFEDVLERSASFACLEDAKKSGDASISEGGSYAVLAQAAERLKAKILRNVPGVEIPSDPSRVLVGEIAVSNRVLAVTWVSFEDLLKLFGPTSVVV